MVQDTASPIWLYITSYGDKILKVLQNLVVLHDNKIR